MVVRVVALVMTTGILKTFVLHRAIGTLLSGGTAVSASVKFAGFGEWNLHVEDVSESLSVPGYAYTFRHFKRLSPGLT